MISELGKTVHQYLGPHLVAAKPSNKCTCASNGHYRVLNMVGVGSGQMGEDGRAGHNVREWKWYDRICWASGTGRNGQGLGRPARRGWRCRKKKLYPLAGYVSEYERFYRGRLGRQEGGGTPNPFRNV